MFHRLFFCPFQEIKPFPIGSPYSSSSSSSAANRACPSSKGRMLKTSSVFSSSSSFSSGTANTKYSSSSSSVLVRFFKSMCGTILSGEVCAQLRHPHPLIDGQRRDCLCLCFLEASIGRATADILRDILRACLHLREAFAPLLGEVIDAGDRIHHDQLLITQRT